MRGIATWVMFAGLLVGTLPSLATARDEATLVIAHRGESSRAPENTLAAFRGALEAEADFVEFDVHLSADGIPVVIHDETVDRTTDGEGLVDTHTLAELRSLDAGSWFGPRFANERIPTLAETLELLRGKTRLLVELKDAEHSGAGKRGGQAARLVKRTLEVIEATGVREQTLLQTFYPANLGELKKQARGIPYAFLYNFPKRRHLATAYAKFHGASGFNPRLQNARRSQVVMAHLLRMQVYVYTPDEAAEFQQAIDLGVDGIITNRPRELKQFLEGRNIRPRRGITDPDALAARLDVTVKAERAQLGRGEPLAGQLPATGPLPWSSVRSLRTAGH